MPNAATPTASAGPALDNAALDRLLASGAVSIPDLTTRRVDFKMYTAAATVSDDTNPETGNPRVHMIGSSTIRDLQGDTMELSALQDMQKAPPGMAIFVNHSYQVPEDLVGRLFDYPSTQMKRDIADLMLDIEILSNVNPRAKQLYAGIQAGVRQGGSIGCMITAAQWVDEDGNPVPDDEIDWWDIWEGRLHLHILGVDPLEWSFVGIPANQRSWVQYAAQGLFRRALSAHDGETAHRLAPLVRAWFPTDFHDDLLNLAGGDAALREFVGEAAPRRGDGKHILWLPGKGTFGLRNPQTKRVQELSRERVGALLAGEATAAAPTEPTTPADKTAHAGHIHAANAEAVTETPAPESVTASADPVTDDASDVTDAASGDTGVEMEKGASQDEKDAQEARSKKYHIGIKDGGNVTKPSADSDVPDSQWADPVNYRYPMPDKAHADNAASRWGDDDNREQYTQDEQDIITKRIEDRQADFGESDDDDDKDKSADDAVDAEKTVSGTGGDILVKADGSHAAYKGTHSHAHSAFASQGGDDNHNHEHSHDDDANHDHHSASSDDAEGDEGAKSAPADGIVKEGIEMPADGVERTVTLSAAPTPPAELPSADEAQRAAMLKMFSDMVAPHGFVVREAADVVASPAAPNARHKDLVDNDADAQRVISYMSNLDMYLDQASACSDQLMDLLNIPDVDRDDDDDRTEESQDNSDVAGPRYPAGVSESAPTPRLLTRAGARNSSEDRARLQTIHDAVYSLTDGMCCSMAESATETPEGEGDNADGADTASGNGGGQSTTDLDEAQRLLGGGGSAAMSVLPQLIASIGEVATTLKSLSLPALDEKVKALKNAVDAAKAQQEALTAEQERTAHEIARLRGTPQGRPTTAQRSIATQDAPIPDVTTESLTPAGQAAEQARQRATAKAQTSVQYVAGVGQCRYWPEGIGKDARPPITQLQRLALEAGMSAIRRALPDGAIATTAEALIAAYTSGGAALIPIVLDGE